MSFAQGFAAGSAAVQRGLDLRAEREERERQEAYRQAIADYNAGIAQQEADLAAYQTDMSAAFPVQQGAVVQGPIDSAAGLNPMAQAGLAAPAGPDVARTVADMPTAPSGLGSQARGVSFGPAPSVPSYIERQRGLANIAMEYGDMASALQYSRMARDEERALREEEIAAERFGREMGLRERTFGETVRSNQAQEGTSRLLAESLASIREMQEGQIAANTRQISLLTDNALYDANRSKHVNAGKDAAIGFRRGLSIDEVYEKLETQYTDPETGELDNANLAIAANAASDHYYKEYLGMNEAQVGAIGAEALDPLNRALEATQNTPDMTDDMFISTYDDAIKNFADPDFSDGIETELVAVTDENGDPTGAYELRYGGEVLPNGRFANRDEVNAFAAQQREQFLSSPFAVVRYIENKKNATKYRIAQMERLQDKEDAFFSYLEANPQMQGKEMELRKFFGLPSGLSTGGRFGGDSGSGSGGDTDVDPAIAAISQRATDEAAAATTASQLESAALTILDAARGEDDLVRLRGLANPDVQQEIDRILASDRYPYRRRLETQGLGLGLTPVSLGL